MNGTAEVVLRKVCQRYGQGPIVLENLDLEVGEGEFVAVIGPSGCGKTTLLRLIAGLNAVTSGGLLINGQPPAQAGIEMAYIFQEPTLLPWLTVAKNIAVPMRLRGVDGAWRRETVRRLLALVGLEEVAGYYPRQLSGGMKMRVSLARALSLVPKIMLMDEPFGALDAMTRNRLNEELLAIRAREAWTAFFVTHSVTEAVFLSTRIVVLTAPPGRIYRVVGVGAPYPRPAEWRESLEFQSLVAGLAHDLRLAGAMFKTTVHDP